AGAGAGGGRDGDPDRLAVGGGASTTSAGRDLAHCSGSRAHPPAAMVGHPVHPKSLAVPVESEKIGSWPGWRQPAPRPAAAAVPSPASTEPDVQDEPDGALVPPARVAPLLRPLRRALGAVGVRFGPGGHGGGRVPRSEERRV